MINIKNLTKKYNINQGNFNINLNIKKGECVGVLGPNGSGKTTLIRQMLGLIKSDYGEIRMNNINVWNNSKILMKDIGYVSGENALINNLTGFQYLNLFKNFRKNQDKNFYQNLINHFDLKNDINIKIKEMSKGMKQKVALIAATMHKPNLLILDEPTSGLDPVMKEQFNRLIQKFKNSNATIFICSHIFEEVAELCNRLVFLKNGRIVKEIEIINKNIEQAKKEFQNIFLVKNFI